jgi:undecaprenyl-diphosphatase
MPLRWIRELSLFIYRVWKDRVGPKLVPLLSTIGGIGIAIAAFALWGFAAIADEVLEKETTTFDTTILLILQKLHTPLLDQIMLGFTFIGDPKVLFVVALVGCFGFILQRQRTEAVILAIAGVGAIGLNFLLKDLFARSRPELWQRTIDVRYYSFPSGHAMISVVVYGLVGYFLATRFKRQNGWIISLTALLVAVIGLSRLYLGVHWPTDIIAGYAAGLIWLVACILTLEVWRGNAFRFHSTSD